MLTVRWHFFPVQTKIRANTIRYAVFKSCYLMCVNGAEQCTFKESSSLSVRTFRKQEKHLYMYTVHWLMNWLCPHGAEPQTQSSSMQKVVKQCGMCTCRYLHFFILYNVQSFFIVSVSIQQTKVTASLDERIMVQYSTKVLHRGALTDYNYMVGMYFCIG